MLVGEEPQLYQVVLNLCVNARDAMPQGGTLTLSARVESSHLVIRVADTGIGIAADKFEAIFEPLYTTKPPGRGTGLGLATVRNLVRSNGGFVSIDSEPGRGAEFKVFWPLLRPEASP
jgi:signal transduction histidine kinase